MDGGKFAYEAYSSGKGGTLKRRDGGGQGGPPQVSGVSKKTTAHQHRGGGGKSCQCFGGTKRSKTKVFLTNLATNLGICLLLFGYTLVGSIVFLAIEGNSSISHQILATTSLASSHGVNTVAATTNGVSFKPQQQGRSTIGNITSVTTNSGEVTGTGQHPVYELTENFKMRADAVRAKTVENIWNITVNLNILYRDNWTRLAAQEISRFQDELVRALVHEEAALQLIAASIGVGPVGAVGTEHRELASSSHPGSVVGIVGQNGNEFEWTFARSFLYSLTVLTTIGYGSVAPRTTLGKTVTMIYAILGIPLTLLYLSSVGAILSRIARGVFSRALCCCLCSNCGYCCYDEQRMADKERRMRKKRQQMELQAQSSSGGGAGGGGGGGVAGTEGAFYVRGGGEFGIGTTTFKDDLSSSCAAVDSSSLTDCESKASSMQGLSILAPVTLCLAMMFLYICVGAFVLHRLERWPPLDAFYFCFMSLTTIGFGNMLPGGGVVSPPNLSSPSTSTPSTGRPPHSYYDHQSNVSTWFCSLYIMSGMALTAMCFNVVHDEIIHRLRHVTASVAAAGGAHQVHNRGGVSAQGRGPKGALKVGYLDDLGDCDPYNLTSPS